jgi:methylenetetrahydrofolate reductase (NADPH)
LAKTFHIDIPEDLSEEIEKCKDNASAKEVGIEWCIQQSKELVEYGVPTLHYYSMGKSDPVYRIAKALF